MKKPHEEFFKRYGDWNVRITAWEQRAPITVEDIYQHFKARMLDEFAEEAIKHNEESNHD